MDLQKLLNEEEGEPVKDAKQEQNSVYRTRRCLALSLMFGVVIVGSVCCCCPFSSEESKIFPGLTGAAVMDTDVILNNGVLMPRMALGTWQYDNETAEAAVLTALEVGFSHIDTAFNYNNQIGVGKAIYKYLTNHADKKRRDLFITTKVPGCGSHAEMSYKNCGQDTSKVIEKNLDQLNVTYVDLILVHFTPYGKDIPFGCGKENCEKMRDQWKALQHAFFLKQARSVGLSNFCSDCIECLMDWPGTIVLPSVNQLQYHVGMGKDPEGLVSFSRSKGMIVQAYSPLGDNNQAILDGEGFENVLETFDKTGAEIALNWVLANDQSVVVKSKKKSHLQQDLGVFNWKLDADSMRTLNRLKKPKDTPSFSCSDADDVNDILRG